MGIIFVTLVAGELLARAFLTSPSNKIFDPELNFAYRPGTTIFQAQEGVQASQVNHLGLVDREHDFSSERKILVVLGDSYAEALHVSLDERFTTRLDRYLVDFDVVNAARTGLHPASFTVVARRLAQKIPIDRFLLVISPGDSNDIARENLRIKISKDGSPYLVLQASKKLQKMRKWIEPLTSHSALAKHLVQKYLPQVKSFYAKLSKLLAIAGGRGQTRSGVKAQGSKDQFVTHVMNIAFNEIRKIAPFDVLFVPNFKYTGKNTIAESGKSRNWEEIISKTASRYGARFVSAGPDLSLSYQKHRQPLNGFSNSGLFRGHFNSLGHAVLARSALQLFESPQSRAATIVNQ